MTTLLLIPTQFEYEKLQRVAPELLAVRSWHVELAGFGIAASGVMARHWIARHSPSRVILAGIAGSLNATAELGAAYEFDVVLCDGVGDGRPGMAFQPPLHLRGRETDRPPAGCLVTVCAASENFDEAQKRYKMASAFRSDPGAPLAEDMEGYAVAMACRVAELPLTILRGISNRAGDRDHARWQIDAALEAVAATLRRLDDPAETATRKRG